MASPLHQNFFQFQPTKDLNRFLREYGQACLSDATPAAPDGTVNVRWQTDNTGNMSAYVPTGGSLNFRGIWNSGTTYKTGDIVTFNGSSYVSLVDNNLDLEPDTNPGSWAVLAAGGGGVSPGTATHLAFYTNTDILGQTAINSPDGSTLNVPGDINTNGQILQDFTGVAVTSIGTQFGTITGITENLNVIGPGWSFGALGGWTVAKAEDFTTIISQRGIGQNRSGFFRKQAVGDTAGIYSYVFADGGIYGTSDEGVTGATLHTQENTGYFHGTVASTTGTGDTHPGYTFTSGNGWTTDGAFMLRTQSPIYSGNLNNATGVNNFWNSTFIQMVPTTGSIPLSTKIAEVTVGTVLSFNQVQVGGVYFIGSIANNPTGNLGNIVTGSSVTVTGFSNAANNGTFTVNGFGNGNQLFLDNGSSVNEVTTAVGKSPNILSPQVSSDNPQTIQITVSLVNNGSVTSTPFAVNDIVTIAGDNFPEQSKVIAAGSVVSGSQTISLLIRNPNGRAYLFCGGVQGSYVSSNENLAFSGMRSTYYAYGSTDGVNLICGFNSGGSTVDHDNVFPQLGSEAFSVNGAFQLFLGAEVVRSNNTGFDCVLEANRVPWAVNDTVENPHFPVYSGRGLWVTFDQTTPTNPSQGTNLATFAGGGKGFAGPNASLMILENTNPVTMYDVGGGVLTPPSGLTIQGAFVLGAITAQAQGPNRAALMITDPVVPGTNLTVTQTAIEFSYLEASTLNFVPDPAGLDQGFWEIGSINIVGGSLPGLSVRGLKGVDGTFTAGSNTITVTNGVITAIV